MPSPTPRQPASPGGHPPPPEGPVVFFDGVCGLCNRFVDFLISRDRAGIYRFAPLQGETAAARLGPPEPGDPSTVVLAEGDRLYRRSDAALRIVAGLGGIFRLALVFRLVPRPLRDAVYGFIAANRYRWFGRKDSCRMPTPEERGRILP